jgi:PRTRC genetic system protein E
MDFFQQLVAISEGLDLTIRIKGKNGKLTVAVLPDSIDKLQPLTTTGTPEQLDADFIGAITKPLAEAKLVVNEAEFNKSLKDAKPKDAPKPAATSKAKEKSKKPAPAAKKAEKQKPEPKKEMVKSEPKKAASPKAEPAKEEVKQPEVKKMI